MGILLYWWEETLTKHRDWNSKLTTVRGSLLCDYANRNSCLVYGPDSPIINLYNSNATPDILDIVVKDFVLPVYLTVCHALTSNDLPVLIDTMCRASFHDPPGRPDFTRTDWATFQASGESGCSWRGGNRQVHWGVDQRRSSCPSGIWSQASTVSRPTASATC
jgi:hypothetical protein